VLGRQRVPSGGFVDVKVAGGVHAGQPLSRVAFIDPDASGELDAGGGAALGQVGEQPQRVADRGQIAGARPGEVRHHLLDEGLGPGGVTGRRHGHGNSPRRWWLEPGVAKGSVGPARARMCRWWEVLPTF
jgi:hypothetical protein